MSAPLGGWDGELRTGTFNRESAIAAGKVSLDFWAWFCAPEVYKFKFPPYYHALWRLLITEAMQESGKSRLALGIPRGFAKTFLFKLFVAWLIAYTDRRFILVVCNTEPLAENFIADVADILDSDNFVRVFGDWKYTRDKDTLGLKKFSFRGRPVILAGLGQGSSLRGLNIKLTRPDVIIMDDMQSKEQAESPTESTKVLSWMIGTLMKAQNNFRCLHAFIGNMYACEGSILKKLQTNAAWRSLVTGAILEDGQSLWPEFRPIDDILEELENDESLGHPEIFYAEVMNDPEAGSRAGVDFSKINHWKPSEHLPPIAHSGFVIIDPSLGKKTSDDIAIGGFLVFDTEPVLMELRVGKFNPAETIREALSLAAKYGVQAIVVESVAYQATLCFWLVQVCQQIGLTGIKALEVTPEGEKKNSRIIQMFKQLTASRERIWIAREVRAQVTHQITYFDPLKLKNKDDILDILAYAYKVMAKYPNEILKPFEMVVETIHASGEDEIEMDF